MAPDPRIAEILRNLERTNRYLRSAWKANVITAFLLLVTWLVVGFGLWFR